MKSLKTPGETSFKSSPRIIGSRHWRKTLFAIMSDAKRSYNVPNRNSLQEESLQPKKNFGTLQNTTGLLLWSIVFVNMIRRCRMYEDHVQKESKPIRYLKTVHLSWKEIFRPSDSFFRRAVKKWPQICHMEPAHYHQFWGLRHGVVWMKPVPGIPVVQVIPHTDHWQTNAGYGSRQTQGIFHSRVKQAHRYISRCTLRAYV